MKFFAVASLAALASAKYAPNIDEIVTIRVSVEHLAQAIQQDEGFREVYSKTEDYNKESNDISFSKEGSVGFKGIEASSKFSAAYVRTTESKFTDENRLTESRNRIYQQKDQIIRKVTTVTNIGSSQMTETTREYVNVGSNRSYQELRAMSVRYINDYIIQGGGSPTSEPWKEFGILAKRCQPGDIMIDGFCYEDIRINVVGKQLWGYDGHGAWPSPEPFLHITEGDQDIYKGYYATATYYPDLDAVIRLSSIRSHVKISLVDHDDSGDNDLMCEIHFMKANLINDMRRNHGAVFSRNMPCVGYGSATINISAP